MTENNKDRYQQIDQEAFKVYPQDKKSTIQREAYNLWNIAKEKEKQDKSSSIFEYTLENLGKECLQTKSKIGGFGVSVKKRPVKPPKTESSPILTTTKTDVADDAIEVEDDSTEPGSSKESCNKNRSRKRNLAQSNLQTELEGINDELASYACTGERTGLSHEYRERERERERERAKALTC